MKIFKNCNIIAHDGTITRGSDIAIDNGKIADVGKNINYPNAQIIDCTDKFVTPTFVNMHAHSPMNIFKGIAEDVHIDDWFNRELWPYESQMQDEDIYWGAKLACCEMLQNGISAFADHYFKGELIAQACEETGIKADIAYTIFGFGGNCQDELDKACRFFDRYKDNKNISPRFGPHSPYICTKQVLKQVIDTAKQYKSGIHIHVSETKQQVEQSKQLNGGKTPFEVLHDAGGFDVPCIVGHGLWIEPSDVSLLGKDTCIAVSPKTYTKLGMYKGDLFALHEQLNIVSGNDGSASSNSIDVLEQIKLFALLGKWNDKACQFTLTQMWQYLMDGHKYLNFNSGKIEKGYSADLNVWNLNTLSTAPVYNPLAAIIYSAVPSVNITDTLINGEFVKQNGALNINTQEIINNASNCAKKIYERGKGASQLYF